jgi:hypothetical protein
VAIIAIKTALGHHVKQGLQWLMVRNVGGIAKLINSGLAGIIVVGVTVGFFGCGRSRFVLNVTIFVRSV